MTVMSFASQHSLLKGAETAAQRTPAAPAQRLRQQARPQTLLRAEEEKSAAVAKVDRSKEPLLFASDQSLSYLDGTLPADFGFDPLGLKDPEGAGGFINPAWLEYSEVIHGRFAMLGAAGCIAPEILATAGVIPQTPDEVIWFKTGVIQPAGTYANYWTDPWSLWWVAVCAMQFAELKRWQDFRHPGSQGKQYFLGLEQVLGGSGTPAYPGGAFFNMLGLGKTEAEIKKLRTSELRNGRLAMLAVFGFGAQAIMTGDGPFKNLLDHLSDPTGHNLLTNFGHIYGQ